MAATSQKRSGTTNRIRQGIKDGCMVQLLYCAVAWGVIFFIKPYAVGLVLGELIGRSFGGVLAVKTGLGYLGICLSNPFAWGLAMFYCLFMVCRILRRESQTEA